MKYVVILFLFSNLVFAQRQSSTSQFKTLQDDLITNNWDLAINGIFLSDNMSLTVRQFEYANFEISLIEIPILLKTRITDKLSFLVGAKFDLYKNRFGLVDEVGVSISTGFQYDINRNSYIQALFSYQVNDTNNIYDYNYESNASFLLRSGFKF